MARLAQIPTFILSHDMDSKERLQIIRLSDCVFGLQVVAQLLDQVLMRRSYGKVIYMNAKVDAFTLGSNLEE